MDRTGRTITTWPRELRHKKTGLLPDASDAHEQHDPPDHDALDRDQSKYGAMRTEAHKPPERNTIAWPNSFS